MKEKITTNQLFIALFLSSVLFISCLSSESLNDNLWDTIISVAIAFIANMILSLPVLMLHRKGIHFQEYFSKNKFYIFVASLYTLYFILSDIIILARLENLFLNTIYPDAPPILLGILILITAFYGSNRGIESVTRSAEIVMIFFLLGYLLLFFGLFDVISLDNREVFFYEGLDDTIKNAVTIFSRASVIPQLSVLMYCTKGKIRNYFSTQLIARFSVMLIIFLTIIAMGRFSLTQIYPFYSIFTIAKLAPFERLDALFSIIWLMVISIKLSVDMLAFNALIRKAKFREKSNLLTAIFAIIILIFSATIVEQNLEIMNILEIMLIPLMLILGTIIPLIYLLRGEHK